MLKSAGFIKILLQVLVITPFEFKLNNIVSYYFNENEFLLENDLGQFFYLGLLQCVDCREPIF